MIGSLLASNEFYHSMYITAMITQVLFHWTEYTVVPRWYYLFMIGTICNTYDYISDFVHSSYKAAEWVRPTSKKCNFLEESAPTSRKSYRRQCNGININNFQYISKNYWWVFVDNEIVHCFEEIVLLVREWSSKEFFYFLMHPDLAFLFVELTRVTERFGKKCS